MLWKKQKTSLLHVLECPICDPNQFALVRHGRLLKRPATCTRRMLWHNEHMHLCQLRIINLHKLNSKKKFYMPVVSVIIVILMSCIVSGGIKSSLVWYLWKRRWICLYQSKNSFSCNTSIIRQSIILFATSLEYALPDHLYQCMAVLTESL